MDQPEQPLETFHRCHQRQVVRHASPLEAAQHLHVGEPFATLAGALQLLGQHGSIQKAQVDALSGQRMDGVRGVADQRQPSST